MAYFVTSTQISHRSSRQFSEMEVLEPRMLFSAVPLITEFLASNDTGLADEDGEYSDWIELFNPGETALDLSGWHLTDDMDDLTQWTLPALSLAPQEYYIIFASGKDRVDADGTELHTNFKLGKSGEYLALIQPDGITVAHEYAIEYPSQETDVSYGLSTITDSESLIAEASSAKYLIPTDGAGRVP